ncbi:MAG: MFS transporter [Alphaproteobacteria bacterium]|nr:MFS transporter [Alphaproteobacteria bacterium]
MTPTAAPTRALVAWAFYDWANSAVATVITSFVFSTYFTRAVAVTPELGTAQWSHAQSASALAIAVLAPILGAVADRGGRRKPWLAAFTLTSIVATALMWYVRPSPDYAILALVLVAIGTLGFEFGTVFYNAMLPDLAPRAKLGRWSGWGWALGYVGGLGALVVCLVGFVQTDRPWFGVGTAEAANIRATTVVVAAWFAVFALPLFLFTPDTPSRGTTMARAVREGLAMLAHTLRQLRRRPVIARFLLAQMLYADGLATLFAFGGIYAAGTFGMSFAEVIQFGIVLNVTAGLGAAAFAPLDDRFGAKRTIVLSLIGLILCGTVVLLVRDKAMFWIAGSALGLFVGPAQAASRSMMARLAPAGERAEMFGLLALSGKATAFLGPALLGWATLAFSSQRAGMATILLFWIAGLAMVMRVKER